MSRRGVDAGQVRLHQRPCGPIVQVRRCSPAPPVAGREPAGAPDPAPTDGLSTKLGPAGGSRRLRPEPTSSDATTATPAVGQLAQVSLVGVPGDDAAGLQPRHRCAPRPGTPRGAACVAQVERTHARCGRPVRGRVVPHLPAGAGTPRRAPQRPRRRRAGSRDSATRALGHPSMLGSGTSPGCIRSAGRPSAAPAAVVSARRCRPLPRRRRRPGSCWTGGKAASASGRLTGAGCARSSWCAATSSTAPASTRQRRVDPAGRERPQHQRRRHRQPGVADDLARPARRGDDGQHRHAGALRSPRGSGWRAPRSAAASRRTPPRTAPRAASRRRR